MTDSIPASASAPISTSNRDAPRSFEKVLVANRGEIARRILRGVRAHGLCGVAVYSDADAGAPHAREADEAVRIGAAPAADSYLNVEHILSAARAVGADAVHPGYGFLSERADFARRCLDAGLVFIGPSPDAIARMGSKIESKQIAAHAGVPVIAGFSAQGLSDAAIAERARELGYPLLIKASAGGGGRGMRVVREPSELEAALASARREASAAFGDDALLVERYLQAPRHVEVQIFGDAHGNVVHCFERECSIQRRHQKLVEEAPCHVLDAGLRARMGEAAVALGKAIGYSSAGTVEFVLDAAGAFYFLEVNTRLQVEHPVTEAITGLDLVRLQLEVAAGRPLPVTQAQLTISGHAIEARLCAEDARRDFLPASGRMALFSPPAVSGVRIDSGVEAGSEVSVHYDSMLAKVIAHGDSREQALRRLIRALRELAVGGVTTNRDFLLQVLEHPDFAAGRTDTGFIDRCLPPERRAPLRAPSLARAHAVAAAIHLHDQRRAESGPVPASIPSGFRNNRFAPQEQRFTLDGQPLAVRYTARAERRFAVEVLAEDGALVMAARALDGGDGWLALELDGVRRRFALARDGERVIVHGAGLGVELECLPRFPARAVAQLAGGCVAPMTGLVRKLCVAVGERVARGDVLLVLEAMKMEHRLVAHGDGVVKELRVREGQMVDPDDVLIVVEPSEPRA